MSMNHHCSFSYLHRLCSHGGLAEAIRYVDTFIKPRSPIPLEILAHLLRECKKKHSLELGRKVHTLIKESSLQHHAQLSSQLIDMFSSCGSIREAAHVFQTSPEPHFYAWNAIICAYVQNGLYEETMLLYARMRGSSVSHTTVEVFIYTLKACINVSALSDGRLIHSDTIRQGLDRHLFLGSILIKMYSRCGSLADALIVFNMLPIRDSACWSALICECVQHGCHSDAFRYYDSMKKEGFEANIAAYLGMLKACAFTRNLNKARMLYMDIVKAGFELDSHIGNALIDTYSKCSSFDESCIVFSKLSLRSVVLWPSMIAGYLRHGRGQEAVELFKTMQKERTPPPDNITYLHLIEACTGIGDIANGHFIHAHMFHIGIDLDPYIQSALVEMYAKSGKLGDAKKVFDMSPRNDNVLLAVMSTAYINSGQEEQSLYLLAKMMQSDIEPDKVLFLCLLQSCMGMLAMEQGRLVHRHILKQGFYLDPHIASALIDMYAQCGSIRDAYNVFENMPNRDAACWNVLISSLSDNGHSQAALYMYEKMQQNCSLYCEKVTFCSVLTACSNFGAIDKGKLIHLDVVKNGNDSFSMIANALVDLYGKCGNLEDAYDVFMKLQGKDVISWSSIISAHVQNWHCEEAFYLLGKMQEAGFDPDHVTFACMAKACANMKSKRYGEFVHSEVMKRGMNSDDFVGNAMVSMYAKMGDIIATLKMFESLTKVQAVTWNMLMWGLSELDMNEKAFQLFREMLREDVVQLDPITYVGVMKSLSDVAGLSAVRVLHIDIICQGFESNIMVQNTLIVVYAKCGSISDASAVFQLMQIRSIVSWNSIMDSCGEQGDYAIVLHCLEGMQEEGIVPNSATFVCILSACSHGGLIQEAYHVYNTMTETVSLISSMQHTVCMIDTLGRAGCLDEAMALLTGSPFQPDSSMWINLLGSCAKYKHIVIGDWAFEHLQQLDPTNTVGYMLLSNIYSSSYSLETAFHLESLWHFVGDNTHKIPKL